MADAEVVERVRSKGLECEGEWWAVELRRRAGAGDDLALAVLEHIAALETAETPLEPPDWWDCPNCNDLEGQLEAVRRAVAPPTSTDGAPNQELAASRSSWADELAARRARKQPDG